MRNSPAMSLLLGEMGIGNTSAASLLLAKLANLDIASAPVQVRAQCGGHRTQDRGVARSDAAPPPARTRWASWRPWAVWRSPPWSVTGAAGAHERRVVLVDGFIATSAVLVARPAAAGAAARVFAHRSGSAWHDQMLQHLGVQPLLDLGLRW